jgi:hypothetical protein
MLSTDPANLFHLVAVARFPATRIAPKRNRTKLAAFSGLGRTQNPSIPKTATTYGNTKKYVDSLAILVEEMGHGYIRLRVRQPAP